MNDLVNSATATVDRPNWTPPASLADLRSAGAGRGPEFWSAVRACFQVAGGVAYLDNADYGPPPGLVLEVQERWQHQLSADPTTPMRVGELEAARDGIGRFIGASGDEIVLTRGATEGISLLLHGFGWQDGDEIVFDGGDHLAARSAFRTLERRFGVRAVDVGLDPRGALTDEQIVERYAGRFTPRSRLLFLSHVGAASGRRLPVRALADAARRNGIFTALDASGSFGALDYSIADLGVDYLAAPGHGWASAGHGTGFAYVRQEVQNLIWPTTGNFYDHRSDRPMAHSARRYDRNAGQKNVPFLLGFVTALEWQRTIGRAAIEKRIGELGDALRQGLEGLGHVELLSPGHGVPAGPALLFRVKGWDAVDVRGRIFRDADVRLGIVDGADGPLLRASPHIHNSDVDIGRALSALAKLAA
ncbi:hypothetical protein A0J57_18845 [Sphingobium sp. 22B]|uniref:aminotransferase class V-fold PLP-dependent enzyme n=1 Tax=unclassified Sphingobium TaxID=2611147 RepID=UPI0007859442|nr:MULTISPECIES: aminotransferase class V-fold PLP-dependent enzyme [unclassified Sphingobium]KXU30497.1 hypothetical protein AXW74_17450 [Sphingobium sp. AM]KYC30756.1 hypothetical protein A0J57_18845 [Sphingobium sp. 22B]OAP30054.1 hypothetical protein A8O16_20430 [Sphingobium sp. 20006FA]